MDRTGLWSCTGMLNYCQEKFTVSVTLIDQVVLTVQGGEDREGWHGHLEGEEDLWYPGRANSCHC